LMVIDVCPSSKGQIMPKINMDEVTVALIRRRGCSR
jgi:hypothetical protein